MGCKFYFHRIFFFERPELNMLKNIFLSNQINPVHFPLYMLYVYASAMLPCAACLEMQLGVG